MFNLTIDQAKQVALEAFPFLRKDEEERQAKAQREREATRSRIATEQHAADAAHAKDLKRCESQVRSAEKVLKETEGPYIAARLAHQTAVDERNRAESEYVVKQQDRTSTIRELADPRLTAFLVETLDLRDQLMLRLPDVQPEHSEKNLFTGKTSVELVRSNVYALNRLKDYLLEDARGVTRMRETADVDVAAWIATRKAGRPHAVDLEVIYEHGTAIPAGHVAATPSIRVPVAARVDATDWRIPGPRLGGLTESPIAAPLGTTVDATPVAGWTPIDPSSSVP